MNTSTIANTPTKQSYSPTDPSSAFSAPNTLLLVADMIRLVVHPSSFVARWKLGAVASDPVKGTPMRGLYQSTIPASDSCKAYVVDTSENAASPSRNSGMRIC